MITKSDAVNSRNGQELYHAYMKNSAGAPVRCRVNGKCQTWKTRPDDFRLPVKHGLNHCFDITPWNASEWNTEIES